MRATATSKLCRPGLLTKKFEKFWRKSPSPPFPGEEMFRKLPKLPPTPSYKCFKEYITLNFEFVTNYVKHIFFHFKTYSNLFSYFGQNEIRKVVFETLQ